MHIQVHRPEGGYPLAVVKEGRENVPLVGFGDLHIGSPNFDRKKAHKVRDWILGTGALWFGMGDLIDNGTKDGPGASWLENTMSPNEQGEYVTELLKPIAGQCIGMVTGNHEERTYKATGWDPTNTIAHNLDVPYFQHELYAKIALERENTYTLYACHSTSAPKTNGLALNYVERDWRWAHFDILAKAHCHSMGFDAVPYVEVEKKGEVVRDCYRYTLLTGHYLTKPNSYNAKSARPPKPTGTIALWLDMKSRDREVRPEYI